jgi:hypothetical protein
VFVCSFVCLNTLTLAGNHFTTISGFFGELAWYFFETHPKTETWYNATKLAATPQQQ